LSHLIIILQAAVAVEVRTNLEELAVLAVAVLEVVLMQVLQRH
jgi:hypothetical protein